VDDECCWHKGRGFHRSSFNQLRGAGGVTVEVLWCSCKGAGIGSSNAPMEHEVSLAKGGPRKRREKGDFPQLGNRKVHGSRGAPDASLVNWRKESGGRGCRKHHYPWGLAQQQKHHRWEVIAYGR